MRVHCGAVTAAIPLHLIKCAIVDVCIADLEHICPLLSPVASFAAVDYKTKPGSSPSVVDDLVSPRVFGQYS